ncbi:MAG: permease-like cell division protein FtsX [Lachnospiraceae bacterium]|nr:permease-like cell division protein FtsX [Lachnospiraceae bacterium]MBQ8666281.1 permease-like cell division protein FtsX [Lachnospiraceae bacterium]
MRISTLWYTFRQGFKNIFRNKVFSLATTATIASCIFLFGLFYCLVINVQYSVKAAQSGVAVTVFFDEGLGDDEIQQIGTQIQSREEVSEIKFVSSAEAWDSFKDDYLGEYADGYEGDNPLEGSENYEIYLKDVSKQPELVEWLKSVPGIREVNRSDITAEVLTNVNILISYVSLAIIAILLLVSVFLISNTVAMGISVRREEISIMRLIGAKDFVVRSPFVIEGILIGLIGSALPLVAIYYLYNLMIEYANANFAVLSDMLKFMSAAELFRNLIPISLILGVGIGFLGSLITVRRHLKV